jgi:hypothetical protein
MNKVEKGNIGQSRTVLKILKTIEYEHQQDRQRQGSGKAWREQKIRNMREKEPHKPMFRKVEGAQIVSIIHACK